MTQPNPPTQFVSVCFYGFDRISQRLVHSQLNNPDYTIELMEEPHDSEVCLYFQEFEDQAAEIIAMNEQLAASKIPMILLTDHAFNHDALYAIIKKPCEKRNLSNYLKEVKNAFYAALKAKLQHQKKHNPAKQIYNKHLSNALNPSQIQYENNRFYAQKYVGLNPDIDFQDEQQVESIQMNAENYFFYHLKKTFEASKAKSKIACLKTVYGVFYIDAQNKVIHHEKTADEIKNIHKIPFYKDSQTFIPKLKRHELDAFNQFDYEPFVWLSSINASKGKIPSDINFSSPIKLVAWPDMSKLVVFKHSIRIVSLWSRGIYSLQHTGKLLGVPQRYPLTVYTALSALGLIAFNQPR